MVSYGGGNQSYSPSAPPATDPQQPMLAHPYHPPPAQYPANPSMSYAHSTYPQSSTASFGSGPTPPPHGFGSFPYQQPQNLYSSFPPGTHPDVVRSFQMVDRNQNGYIEEMELQQALAWNYQKFSLRTLRLLIFLFRNPRESSFRIGPKEFAEVWSCLGQWRAIFARFDRDRSGKIDAIELRDALYSLGFALPPSVLQLLISRYDDDSGRRRVELNFDSFVESGMIVKGLTEKFKEKDPGYTGSAKLTYDTFMSMLIPFLVSD
ncbi:putative calcium-binding protein CML48 [Primulina tabacum]|uniref:putative calcium-binding protein CML48 n=1 Tax=Primulina tabacum TaxID=48773 RepID=UPI003F5A7655